MDELDKVLKFYPTIGITPLKLKQKILQSLKKSGWIHVSELPEEKYFCKQSLDKEEWFMPCESWCSDYKDPKCKYRSVKDNLWNRCLSQIKSLNKQSVEGK